MKTILESLARQLQSATYADLENCEQMYTAKFRSAVPFPASKLDNDEFSELAYDAKIAAYVEPIIGKCPAADWYNDDDECSADLWAVRAEELLESTPEVVTSETLVVELCNYKGEGEGFALFENTQHLPVFISKSHSTDFFNC